MNIESNVFLFQIANISKQDNEFVHYNSRWSVLGLYRSHYYRFGEVNEGLDDYFFALVYCVDLKDATLTKDEVIALTRDHFARRDPDELLNGFFPVWAVIQFIIACKFLPRSFLFELNE